VLGQFDYLGYSGCKAELEHVFFAVMVQDCVVAALDGPAVPGCSACTAGSGSGSHSSKPMACRPPVPAAADSQGELAALHHAGCTEALSSLE
jgi:hypothetical protein